ncbi:ketoacyl-synt-domain-containing protein [Xylariomycetidae sp. FL0641]|nr:ketoacyl-synt-domain-containing protein [Xylariomycetidae sp. FL0641]
MGATRQHVFLFGDQTDDVTPTIFQLYALSRRSALLAEFLRQGSDTCQIEFAKLEPCFRYETPHFESLLEMAENQAKTDGSPVLVSCALSYFGRIGELLVRAEDDHTLLTSDRTTIGLCISVFSAAIAATARTPTELVKIAVEGFPTYFAMIISNHYRTKRIEWTHGHWSYLVMKPSDTDLQPYLDKFHEEFDVPVHRQCWIGVVGRTWVTVSGPPSNLKQLIAHSTELKALPGMDLPVAGAVHAPHLPPLDFDILARKSWIWDLPIQANATIMSTESCQPYPMKTLGEIARQLVPDVTQARLMVDGTISATAAHVQSHGAPVAISILGPSAQAGTLIKSIKLTKLDAKVLPVPAPAPKVGSPLRAGSGAIAIVGMAGKFPEADDMDQFWKVLMEGRTTHRTIPKSRFDLNEFYDATGAKKNSCVTSDGCFIGDPGSFDTRLFNMSPREASQLDPVHRLLLMTSLEALEKAGYNPDANLSAEARRTAVFFGQNADVWREINMQQGVDVFTAPGLLRAFSPGRVNYHFGFEGGSYNLDAACSSSSTAIQLACTALENRDVDMALAGGAQIASNPFEFAALGVSGFLARSGGCKTFRADADGYCRGEAAGVVVLKRLEDAVADNDSIEAVVTGWGRNYSAGASSITHPHPESQEKLVRRVLRQAAARPADVGYVELHGTGTIAGDLSEMTLTTRVFNGHARPDRPLHVGALKANMGHSEAAAGVSSVMKAALITKKLVIPPQAGIAPATELHPGFAGLDLRAVRIDTEPATLDKARNRILVNNFDAAGGNTCLLIEGAPAAAAADKAVDPRGWHAVAVSAQTNPSLRANKQRLLAYLQAHPETRLADVAYSTTARRMHHARKAAFAATSTEDLMAQLARDLAQPLDVKAVTGAPPPVHILFTGQGSHYAGMAHELWATHPAFRATLGSLQTLGASLGLPGFLDVFANPDEDLAAFSAAQLQLAVVCLELALAELWGTWGLKPAVVAGHSLGEYAALCVAGVLSVSDTLWLVGRRAQLLEAACVRDAYGMLSLAASAAEVDALLAEGGFAGTVEHACYNSPRSNVVSGPADALGALAAFVAAKGVRAKLLPVPYAFHSAQLDAIYEDFRRVAGRVSFLPPQIPVASTVTGELVDRAGVFDAGYLARHARQPVRFCDALRAIDAAAARSGTKTQQAPLWLELGPSPVCSSLLRETLDVAPAALLPSLKSGESNWRTVAASLGRAYVAGAPVHWPEFHRHHAGSVKLLDLPTYAFDLKPYWQPYTRGAAAVAGITVGDAALLPAAAEASRFRPTATVHRVVEEAVSADRVEVTFASGLDDARLRAVVRGHEIEGASVCPASAYVDMAGTAAGYVHLLAALPDRGKNSSPGTIVDLELVNPLVLLRDESARQTVEIVATAAKADAWTVHVSFRSRADGASKSDDHGKCRVLLAGAKDDRKAEWAETAELAKQRIRALMHPGAEDDDDDGEGAEVHHLRHKVLYKLFGSVVRYGERYRAIREAFVDYGYHDAVAKVRLTPAPAEEGGGDDAFVLNPYHSDALVHLAGFLLNSNDDDDLVHFSSGLSGMVLAGEVRADRTYLSYVRMLTSAKGESVGDVYLFDGDEVVGVVAGLKFHQMRRAVLKLTLGLATGAPPAVNEATSATPAALGEPGTAAAAAATPAGGKGSLADAFIAALVAETGVDPSDMEDSTELSELGVDSLMGMAILQKVQRDTGETLPATIFFELQTIGDVKAHLGSDSSDDDSAVGSNNLAEDDHAPATPTDVTSISSHDGEEEKSSEETGREPADPEDLTKKYTSNVVLLQGGVKSKTRPLFFVAGSSGAASIYTQLPKLGSGTPVYVLESPFLACPHEMRHTPEQIAGVYVAAIKGVQPTGPYLVGGYSAGAVHAYEIARHLLERRGDAVERLILADMKAHRPGETWTAAPRAEDLDGAGASIGAVDKNFRAMRSWEMARANRFAMLQCMYNWKPTPMTGDRKPTKGTVMVWARWGMCERFQIPGMVADADVNPMAAECRDYKQWFFARRHTYGANGWDVLVGDNIETHVVDGDHWNMLEPPYAAALAKLIDQAIPSA